MSLLKMKRHGALGTMSLTISGAFGPKRPCPFVSTL